MDAVTLSIYLKAIDEMSPVFKQVENSSSSLNQKLGGIGQTAAGFVAASLAIAGVGSAIDAVKGVVVGFNSQLEQSTIAWKTFTGSADAANSILQQIQQIAAVTPFEFADVDKAAKRFVNAGFSAQQALGFITPLANAVASVGLGAEGVDRVSLALAQMTQKTRVQGQEMLQLTEAQIPAWDILAQATGKPIPELQKLVTAGQVSAKEFTDAFQQFYGETGRFANAAHDQSLTFAGSMSTIKDELNIVGSTAFKPIFEALSNLARGFAAFVQSDEFTVWGARINAVVGLVMDGLGGLIGAFQNVLGGVLSTVSTVGRAIYQGLQWLNPFAAHSEPLVSQVEGGVKAINAAFGTLDASATFDSLKSSFENLTAVTANFATTFGDDLPSKVEAALAIMGPGAALAFHETSAAVDAAKDSLLELKASWDGAKDALTPFKDALDAAKDGLKAQQDSLGDLRTSLADAKSAYDPLKQSLDDYTQSAKDANSAIKDLRNTQLEGTSAYDSKISGANIALKEQQLSLAQLKHSDTYTSIGAQIDAASIKIKEMQRNQSKLPTGAVSTAGRDAIIAAQAALDGLKEKQAALLDPAQKELDKRRDSLDLINLEKEATVGLAQDRIKAAADAALGIKEISEKDALAQIATAKSVRDAAQTQVDTLTPQVKAQAAGIKVIETAIRSQETAVASAQKAVDVANASYSDQKQIVDALGQSYQTGKAELASYDQQLKALIQTGDLQVQKAKEAKTAADSLAKAGTGVPGTKPDVLAGLDIAGGTAKIKAFQDNVAATKAQVTDYIDTVKSKVEEGVALFTRLLGPIAGTVAPLADFLQRFASILGVAGVALLVASPLIAIFGAVLAPIAGILLALVSPLGLVVLGIAAFASAWSTNLGGIQEKSAGLIDAFLPFRQLPDIIDKALGGDVLGAIGEFIHVLGTVRTNLIEQVATWAAAFVDWLIPVAPRLTGQLLQLMGKLLSWIEAQADVIVTRLLKWGTAFLEWLLPRVPAIIAMLATVALNIIDWIAQQGVTLANHLGAWAAAFIQWVIPMLPYLATALQQIAGGIIDFIFKAVPKVLGALADWAGAFLSWIVPLLPGLLGALLLMVGSMVVWLVEVAAPKIVTGLLEWGKAFVDWVGPRIQPFLDEVGKLWEKFKDWIGETAPKVLAKLAEWGEKFGTWVTTDALPTLKKAVEDIWTFLGPWIHDRVQDLGGKLGEWAAAFVNWITDPTDGAVHALTVELPKILTQINDWINTTEKSVTDTAMQIGTWLIKGIVDGLKGLASALGDAWEAAKNGFLKDIKPITIPNPFNFGGGAQASDASYRPAGAGGGADGAGQSWGGGGFAAGYDPAVAAQYIKAAAAALGIRPGIALAVAQSEGLNNPEGDRNSQGVPQSFGPFQLFTGGGLGNQFKAQTGMDPADYQHNWQAQVDFALNWAKQNGWNPGGQRTATGATGGGFHGATAAGIGNWEGLREAMPPVSNAPTGSDTLTNPLGTMAPTKQDLQLLDDYTMSIQSIGKSLELIPGDAVPAGKALDNLALQTGKPRGAFLELAATSSDAFKNVMLDAQTFGNHFGITIDKANEILMDHGSVAKAVLGTGIPGQYQLTDLAVERFASEFKISWDLARQILSEGGKVSEAVMGVQVPTAAAASTEALKTTGAAGGVAADGLGVTGAAAAKLANTLVLTGNPAVDSFNAALAKIPAQAKAAADAWSAMVAAMDRNEASSGPGGSLRQAASQMADIGVHTAQAFSGALYTISKTYAQMTQQERDDANRFGTANPGGLSSGSSAPSGGSSGSSSSSSSADFSTYAGRQAFRDANPGAIVDATGAYIPPPGRAMGGPVMPGRQYLVGEMGAELFVPDSVLKMAKDMLAHPSVAAARGSADQMPYAIGEAGRALFQPTTSGYVVPAGIFRTASQAIDPAALKRLAPSPIANAVMAVTSAQGMQLVERDRGEMNLDRRMTGGIVSSGHPYLVGENGPQLYVSDAAIHAAIGASLAADRMPYIIGEAGRTQFTPPATGYIVPRGALKAASQMVDPVGLRRVAPVAIADAVLAATKSVTRLSDQDRGELGLERRAAGGPVESGRRYLVGEQGAEVFAPRQSGTIIPNGGGAIDYDRMAKAIARELGNMPAPRVAVEDVRSSLIRVGARNAGQVGLA